MNDLIMFIAQATPAAPTTTRPGAGPFFMFALMIGLVAFMLLTSRSQKKREKRERENMHARMAKNDRVLTIGGVVGTVISVKDDEVVVKVDESTNTKMTFIKTAIQRIITEDQDAPAGR